MVKRVCQKCGYAWEPPGCLTILFRVIWNTFFVIVTKGSAVDVVALKNRNDKTDTTCPNCNYTVYRDINIANTNNQVNRQGNSQVKKKRWIDK